MLLVVRPGATSSVLAPSTRMAQCRSFKKSIANHSKLCPANRLLTMLEHVVHTLYYVCEPHVDETSKGNDKSKNKAIRFRRPTARKASRSLRPRAISSVAEAFGQIATVVEVGTSALLVVTRSY